MRTLQKQKDVNVLEDLEKKLSKNDLVRSPDEEKNIDVIKKSQNKELRQHLYKVLAIGTALIIIALGVSYLTKPAVSQKTLLIPVISPESAKPELKSKVATEKKVNVGNSAKEATEIGTKIGAGSKASPGSGKKSSFRNSTSSKAGNQIRVFSSLVYPPSKYIGTIGGSNSGSSGSNGTKPNYGIDSTPGQSANRNKKITDFDHGGPSNIGTSQSDDGAGNLNTANGNGAIGTID